MVKVKAILGDSHWQMRTHTHTNPVGADGRRGDGSVNLAAGAEAAADCPSTLTPFPSAHFQPSYTLGENFQNFFGDHVQKKHISILHVSDF